MRKVFASTPVLLVSDLRRSVDFYVRALGYEEPALFGEPPEFAMIHRDGHDLMLSLAEKAPHPNGGEAWDVHLRVADLAAERAALVAADATILRELEQTEYGMRELVVVDPDGHWICLGQDLERRPEDR
jgi:catechol 2,3-dioxygenase-like lactoylglutathione lyase family enzyme